MLQHGTSVTCCIHVYSSTKKIVELKKEATEKKAELKEDLVEEAVASFSSLPCAIMWTSIPNWQFCNLIGYMAKFLGNLVPQKAVLCDQIVWLKDYHANAFNNT